MRYAALLPLLVLAPLLVAAQPPAPPTGSCCTAQHWVDPQDPLGAWQSSYCVNSTAFECSEFIVGVYVDGDFCATGPTGPGALVCCDNNTFCDQWFATYYGTGGHCEFVGLHPRTQIELGYCVEESPTPTVTPSASPPPSTTTTRTQSPSPVPPSSPCCPGSCCPPDDGVTVNVKVVSHADVDEHKHAVDVDLPAPPPPPPPPSPSPPHQPPFGFAMPHFHVVHAFALPLFLFALVLSVVALCWWQRCCVCCLRAGPPHAVRIVPPPPRACIKSECSVPVYCVPSHTNPGVCEQIPLPPPPPAHRAA